MTFVLFGKWQTHTPNRLTRYVTSSMIAAMENTPLTSAEKMRALRRSLHLAAQLNGYDTWAKFETAVRRAVEDGNPLVFRIRKDALKDANKVQSEKSK
jgi:hypothetical protein